MEVSYRVELHTQLPDVHEVPAPDSSIPIEVTSNGAFYSIEVGANGTHCCVSTPEGNFCIQFLAEDNFGLSFKQLIECCIKKATQHMTLCSVNQFLDLKNGEGGYRVH